MPRILSLVVLLFSLTCIGCHAVGEERCIYVSSSLGSDENAGYTQESPKRTIAKALKAADTIYLKAGDVFYGSANFKGKVVTKYGEGDDPVICGFRYLVAPKWEPAGDHLWKLNMKQDAFKGVEITDSRTNNVGCIYDIKADVVHGCKLQYKDQLKKDWDFWQTSSFMSNEVNDSTFNELYLYLTTDPNQMELAFSTGHTGVTINNGSISHVKILGFGIHGIAAGSNTDINNCSIDIIGGSIQIGYKNYVRLGNGIEFYVSSNVENSMVDSCVISRCYDCGVTIQGSGRQQAAPSNITIRKNYIHDCCQGWEDFLRNGKEDMFNNCVFSENLLVDNGSKIAFGYGDGRFKYCQVLGNNTNGNRGMILRDNIFINGNYYCSGSYNNEYKSHVWENNICYMQRGQFLLSNYVGTKDVIRLPQEQGSFRSLEEATEDAIGRYRTLTGDLTTQFIIIEEKDKDNIVRDYLFGKWE